MEQQGWDCNALKALHQEHLETQIFFLQIYIAVRILSSLREEEWFYFFLKLLEKKDPMFGDTKHIRN